MASMITLHHLETSRSQRVLWLREELGAQVQAKLIDPNVATALAFMEAHLASHAWFAGEHLRIADFQMSFAVEAALARGAQAAHFPKLGAFKTRMTARQAYQHALSKGGPVLMS